MTDQNRPPLTAAELQAKGEEIVRLVRASGLSDDEARTLLLKMADESDHTLDALHDLRTEADRVDAEAKAAREKPPKELIRERKRLTREITEIDHKLQGIRAEKDRTLAQIAARSPALAMMFGVPPPAGTKVTVEPGSIRDSGLGLSGEELRKAVTSLAGFRREAQLGTSRPVIHTETERPPEYPQIVESAKEEIEKRLEGLSPTERRRELHKMHESMKAAIAARGPSALVHLKNERGLDLGFVEPGSETAKAVEAIQAGRPVFARDGLYDPSADRERLLIPSPTDAAQERWFAHPTPVQHEAQKDRPFRPEPGDKVPTWWRTREVGADGTWMPRSLAEIRDAAGIAWTYDRRYGRRSNADFAVEWFGIGSPTFEITGSLAAALCLTECGGLKARDVRAPFSAWAVQMPSPSPVTYNGQDVRFICLHGNTALVFPGALEWAVPIGVEGEEPVEPIARVHPLKRFLINLCVYIASLHALPAPEGRRKPQASGKRAGASEAPPPQRWVLGRAIKLSPGMIQAARSTVAQGASKKARAEYRIHARFMVRGHWRRQAYGPKHAERRMRWIEPFWKGPEMADGLQRLYSLADASGKSTAPSAKINDPA